MNVLDMDLGKKMGATAQVKTKGNEAGGQPRWPALKICTGRRATGFGKNRRRVVVTLYLRIKSIG
jgi:hypothetical protein